MTVTRKLACLAALAMAAPLAAEPEITVKGQRIEPEQAHAQAVEYVRRVGIATGITPAARWLDPVCLEVLGVEPAIGALVSARFKAIATRAGARLAKAGCRTNAVIAFSGDGANYVRKLERADPAQFEELTAAQREAIREGKSPVRWWYRTDVRGADGERSNQVAPQGFSIVGEGSDVGASGASTDGGPRQNVVSAKRPSLIATSGKREIKGAAVVIDVNLASGRPLASVGELASLLLLAEIRPLSEPPPGSILSLFTPLDPRPDILTPQDESMLKALYALPLAREARFHRGKLVDGLTQAALGTAK